MSIENIDENENPSYQLGTDIADDDSLPPLEIKAPPGFLRFFPPVIKQIAELGAQFKMETDGALYIEGFYRNGPMKIDFEGETVIAVDRRGRKTPITHFDDLVQLNFQWWRISNGRSGYVVPERPWIDQFIEKKWVKRKVIFEPLETIDSDKDENDLS